MHNMLTYSCESTVSIHTNRLPTIVQCSCVQEQLWLTHPRDSPNAEIETTHDENADAVTSKEVLTRYTVTNHLVTMLRARSQGRAPQEAELSVRM